MITPPRNDTSRGIAYLAALLLYLAILTYGLFIATGIVTEKATRVVEVILSAVRPIELLAGKIGGLGLLSLGQFSLVALVALATAEVAGVSLPVGAPLAIVLAVVFSLLGYLLYACAFAVAGSIVSRQEDLQSSSAPLTMILVGGFILTQASLNNPRGTLATVLSMVPLTAPLAMPSRVALTYVPAWQIALSALLTLATALLVLRARREHLLARPCLRMGQRLPLARGAAPPLRGASAGLALEEPLDCARDPALPRLRGLRALDQQHGRAAIAVRQRLVEALCLGRRGERSARSSGSATSRGAVSSRIDDVDLVAGAMPAAARFSALTGIRKRSPRAAIELRYVCAPIVTETAGFFPAPSCSTSSGGTSMPVAVLPASSSVARNAISLVVSGIAPS